MFASRPARILFVALCALLGNRAARAETRYAVLIGNNLGHDKKRELRFAERDARKLYRALLDVAGVPAANMRLLLGKTASEVERELGRIERVVASQTDKTLLFLYFAGHADGSVLELGQTSFEYGRLLRFLKRSKANIRLAFIDSCRSGALVRTRGGHPGRDDRLRVRQELAAHGYAVLTSSTDNELSQESRGLRGSFFTHHLVSALRGAGDYSGDGRITLSEIYHYVYQRTVASTASTIGGAQHPMYKLALSGRGGIVLSRRGALNAALSLVAQRGQLVVLDPSGASLIAEVDARSGRPVALAAGRYHIYWLDEGRARHLDLTLSPGEHRRLRTTDLAPKRLALAVARGGLFTVERRPTKPLPATRSRHRLGLAFVLRRGALSHTNLSTGIALCYQLDLPLQLALGLQLSWAMPPDARGGQTFHELGALLRFSRWLPLSNSRLYLGIYGGYDHLVESKSDHSGGLAYGGFGSFELPWWPIALTLTGAVGGRLFRVARGSGETETRELTHRLDLSVLAGVTLPL